MKVTAVHVLGAWLLLTGTALADDKIVKIGALSDQASLYADVGGPGSTLAALMAVEDSGLLKKGWTIDVVSGDHQNKPDMAPASHANGSMKTRSM